MTRFVDIVFSGEGSDRRFVEVEDDAGKSICFGQWVKRPDGFSALRLTSELNDKFYSNLANEVPAWPL